MTRNLRDKKSQTSESLEAASSLAVGEHAVLLQPTGALFVANESHVTSDNHGRPATSAGSVAISTVAQTVKLLRSIKTTNCLFRS